MPRSRFFLSLALAVVVLLLQQRPAEAFWGFGSGSGAGKSGLDLVQGYDRNTVVTLEGRVVVTPDPAADPVTVEVMVGSEQVMVVLGPRWYLQHDDLDWKAGDSITVRGSKAQGSDGRTYLLTQWVSSPAGGQMVMRSESGRPEWTGGFRGGMKEGAGPMQPRSAGSMRRGDMGSRGMR